MLISCEKSSGGGGGASDGGNSGGGGNSTIVSGSRPETDQTPRWCAGVTDAELYGYIDANGNMAISAEYVNTRNFSSEIAMVANDDRYLFVDKDGKEISGNWPENIAYDNDCRYDRLRYQDCDINKLGLVDKQFNVVIPAKYNFMGFCGDNGYCWFTTNDTLYGFVNRDGKEVIPAQFVECYTFYDGATCVGVAQNNGDTLYGIIDATGKYLMEPQPMYLVSLCDGMFAYLENEYWGICDKRGNKLTEAIYQGIWDYVDGIAICQRDDKYGYVDKKGVEIIAPQYIYANNFSAGYTWVSKSNESWLEMINTKGETVYSLPTEYGLFSSVRNGLSLVIKWSDYSNKLMEFDYIDIQGNIVYSWVGKYEESSSAPIRKGLNLPKDDRLCSMRDNKNCSRNRNITWQR